LESFKKILAITDPVDTILSLIFSLSEYITVSELSSLVKIPESVPLDVAAMMPSGAVIAYNAVIQAKKHIDQQMSKRGVQRMYQF
jgi:NADPH:quinone reductase-like Zn-dependent oxidoreductase